MRTKRILSRVFIGVFMCLCLLFTACGKVEGTYKFKKLSYVESGVTVELVAGEKFMGAMTLTEDFMVITLEESGVVTMISSTESGTVATGTWMKMEEKDKISITIEGDSIICICDGKTLTFELEGVKMTLEK